MALKYWYTVLIKIIPTFPLSNSFTQVICMMYFNYHEYKALTAIENTYSKKTLDEELPVAYDHFKGVCLLFTFSIFFIASSLDKKCIKKHNNYLTQSTVHFVFWGSLVQCQFHRICMVTTFVNVRYISLKVRFYLC